MMKDISIIGIILLLSISNLNAQLFHLNDSVFRVNQIFRTQIYFNYNTSILDKESYLKLDSIFEFMQKNPQLTLEVGYHTDSRTDESISWRPSESRAESMVDYLVRKGIDQERLYAKGYGDSEPIIDNKYIESLDAANREAAHAVNRRTEFKIICTSLYSNLFYRRPDTFSYSDSVFAFDDVKRLNLFWEPNGVELLPESMVILDSLILFLQTHPNLTVEIGCHSDNRGQDAYNQKLTERRINCVKQHMERGGVNLMQIFFKGYGESQPLISERELNQICPILIESAHKRNRRVEIKILRF